ncbi:MAG: host attachment protein [Myxococcales bacterium FL481]|nr:MAG: host attachment protein [Myxococcales bacterium FL481]
MKLGNTWILVADASRGRILLQRRDGAALERVFTADFRNPGLEPGPTRRQQHQQRRTGPHSAARRDRSQRHAHAEFARELAGTLDQATHAAALDHIVLVAPPALLGEIRTHMSSPARGRVCAELHKDYVRMTDRELTRRLGDVLYFAPRPAV